MGSSSNSLIEMSMCDAALHNISCHAAIRVPQGYTVVCKNGITRIGLKWLYLYRGRGFASGEQEDCLPITFQMMQPGTRAKMCPTTCVVQQNATSRKVHMVLA